MKRFILSFLFLFFGNELMGMDRDLPLLCKDTQECLICFSSVNEIRNRQPQDSLFALRCCSTDYKAKNAEVNIICDSCFTRLQSENRPATFAENSATIENGGFKLNFACPMCRSDLNNKENKLEKLAPSFILTDPSQADIDLIINGYASFRKSRTLAFIVAGTAGGYGLYLLRRMIFKAEDIDRLEKSALSAQDSLLSLNFDLSNPIPLLSKQYDIPVMLKTIQDEPLRQQLEQAISEFDAALETTFSTIVSRYYYQTAEHFLEKEQELVAQLASSQAQLQALIVECKKQRQLATIGLLKISCATSIAAACGYYWAKASPLKKWGLF